MFKASHQRSATAGRTSQQGRRAAGSAALAAAAAIAVAPVVAEAGLGSYVDQGTFNGDTGRYNAAVNAINNITNRYNAYGDFGNYNIYVYYNSGIPTAQSDYLGSIGLGGTYPNDRVVQHESNHYLGSGTTNNWYGQFNGGGVWTGAHMAQLIQQFDGDGAVIRQSGVHFYGYGLNYDNEVFNDSVLMRNVALIYAQRQDDGLGNGANPWSATNVTLTASDPAGTSAFNWFGGGYSNANYQGWSDKYFAHAGAAYSTGANAIRTPNGTPSWTFAGNSLTINPGGSLLFNGYGTGGVVTINNLTLAGGTVRHDQVAQDLFQLAGSVNVTAASTVDAANGPITVLAPVYGAAALTKIGGYALTLSGRGAATGDLNVNVGTVVANAANNSLNPTTGALGNPQAAHNVNVNAGATLRLAQGDTFGSAVSTVAQTLVINAGGTVTNAGNNFNTLGPVKLNGGTLTGTGGSRDPYQMYNLRGTVTVGGTAPSTISGTGSYAGYHLAAPTVFNVADVAAGTDLTVSGTLVNQDGTHGSAAGGLTKAGTGTMVLSGANAYAGMTTVSAGQLAFTTAASTVGPVTVADAASLRVAAAGVAPTLTATSLTLGSTAGAALAFDLNGSVPTAPLVSTGVFTASGPVAAAVQNGGALTTGTYPLLAYTSFAGNGTFPTGPITLGPRSVGTLSNNGAVSLTVTADRPIWTGRDNNGWVAGNTGTNGDWKLQSTAATTDYIQGDNVLFDDTATGSTAVVITAATVAPAATTFNNSAKNYTLTSTNGYGIAGTGGLTKSGTGTLTLSTANTMTGPVVINGGTLYANLAGNPAANATFGGVTGITVNGGTLRAGLNSLFGFGGTTDRPVTVNAGGTLATDAQGDVGVGLVTLNGGTMTTGGANAATGTWRFQDATSQLLVTDNSTVSGVNYKFQAGAPISVAAGKSLAFAGTITDTNNFGTSAVVKNGGGTVVLSAVNTYTGGTTVNGGVASIAADAGLGGAGTAVTLNGGGLTTTAAVANSHPVTVGANGGTITVATAGQLYFGGANLLVGSGALTLNGGGTLVAGAGNLRLASTNTFNGPLTIQQGGILEYGTTGSIDGGAPVTLASQSELAVQGGSATSMPNPLTVTGGTNTVLSFENGAAGVYAGPVALNANLTVGLRNWYNNATVQSGAIAGVISGPGGLTVNSGTGTGGVLTLSAANTFTGNVTVNAATVLATFGANDFTAGGRASGAFGNEQTAGKTVTINSGGTVSLAAGNALGSGGSVPAQAPTLRFVVNAGGTLRTAAPNGGGTGTGGGDANILGPVTLNGGTLSTGNGFNAQFQAVALLGTVTVGGTGPSTINTVATNTAASGVQLSTANTTFAIADTGSTGTDLTVSAVLADSPLGAAGLTKTGAGNMLLSGVVTDTYTGPTTVSAGRLTFGPGSPRGTVPRVQPLPGGLAVGAAGQVVVGTSASRAGRTLLAPTGLSVAGQLDLTNNDLDVPNGSLSAVTALATTGFANGTWTGNGLTSSTAAADSARLTAVGVIANQTASGAPLYASFDGRAVAATDVLARYTVYGDTNLDGSVTAADYTRIDVGFVNGLSGWGNGDFNYDGTVDGTDYALMDNAFNQQAGTIGAAASVVASLTASPAAAVAAVPEPAGVGAVVAALAVAARRRSRRCRPPVTARR